MPVVNCKLVERLTPFRAHSRGYMSWQDAEDTAIWECGKWGVYHNYEIVYVNGRYVGISNSDMSLYHVVEKFNI